MIGRHSRGLLGVVAMLAAFGLQPRHPMLAAYRELERLLS